MFPSNFMQKIPKRVVTLGIFEDYRFMEIEQFMSRFQMETGYDLLRLCANFRTFYRFQYKSKVL